MGLTDCILIVVISLTLCQKEKVLMRFCGPISHAFWHGCRLIPDNVTPEPPAVILQGNSETSRDHHQVFGLITGGCRIIFSLYARSCKLAIIISASTTTGVTIPDIEPKCPVLA